MAYNKHLYVSFLLTILIIFLSTQIFSEDYNHNWYSIHAAPFILHSKKDQHPFSKIILGTLAQFYRRISEELDYHQQSSIQVYLCDSEQEYRSVAGVNLPKWSEGVAIPSANTIILKTYQSNSDIRKTAVHELSHIMLHSMVKEEKIPRWFDEGLAVYYSDEQEFASRSLVSRALISNSIIPLSEIDHVLSFGESKAQLAYQESYLTIIFLIDQFGVEGLRKIIHSMAVAGNMDEALMQSIGMDLWEFETAWLKYINKKHRWQFLVDFETYLWIFMLLLFILGFIKLRQRNKRTLDRWEEEERTES